MLKIFAVAALALLAAACAKSPANIAITQHEISAAVNAYDAAELTAGNYLSLPRCPAAAVCQTLAGATAVAKATRAGRAARDDIETHLGVGATPATSLDALNAATAALQALVLQYHIPAS